MGPMIEDARSSDEGDPGAALEPEDPSAERAYRRPGEPRDRVAASERQSSVTQPSASLSLNVRERRALSVLIYLAPVVLTLLVIALVRDMWPPFRLVAVMFFLGWLLAFLLDPMVDWLVARVPALPRGPAVALAFVLVAGVVIVLFAVVLLSFAESGDRILQQGPVVAERLNDSLASLQAWLTDVGLEIDVTGLIDDLVEAARSQLEDTLAGAVGGSVTVVTVGTTIVFIASVMVASKSSMLVFTRRLVPPDRLSFYDALTLAIHRSFGGFIRSQFGLAFVYGLFVGVLAIVLGIPYVAFIAVTTTLLATIPFFGQLVSWMPFVLVTFVFIPDQLVLAVAIMLVGWLFIQQIISPRVTGSAVGLNPLVVLFAVFAGSAVAGPLGAVFGVPIVAAMASLFTAWLDHVRPVEAVLPPAETIEAGPLDISPQDVDAVADG
jgi:predicted PurR-regulated permease PerM